MENTDNHREHLTVDIDDAWVTSMRQKLAATRSEPLSQDKSTIYRVPKHIYETDKEAYEPKIISIGPYHHGKQCLQTMEDHKWLYLNAILSQNLDLCLENYLSGIKAMETRVRSCYSEGTDHLESNQFVQMMVLDGCFIVELFLKSKKAMTKWKKDMEEGDSFFSDREKESEEDPIYGTNWMIPLVVHDMLLLENQVPFFVLQSLFELVDKSSTPSSLLQLALDFFDHLVPRNNGNHPKHDDPGKVLHLLHLFHSSLVPVDKKSHKLCCYMPCLSFTNSSPASWNKRLPAPPKSTPSPKSIPSATELKEVGVIFKKTKKGSFLEVNFSKGVMKIPHLSIYDSTNYLFRNFIAFEQCFPISGAHFTSYAILMDCLIKTPSDVAILKQNKIIEQRMGSDKEVALLFNRLGKGVNFENRYFYLYKDVNKYCETKWHIWRVKLVRRCFSNPCSTMMSVMVAIFLFFLVVAAAMYNSSHAQATQS